MGMFVGLFEGARKLVGLSNRKHEPPKVKLDEYNNFVKATYDAAKRVKGTTKDLHGILAKEFKGFIENSSSALSGRYLHSIIKKLNGSTVVLTAISDRAKLEKEFNGKSCSEKGEYELSYEDLPSSEDLTEGYLLLVISGNEKAAIQINAIETKDEKSLLPKIADATLQASSKSDSAIKAIEWLKDSDYRQRGSVPRGAGFLLGS